MKNNIRITIDGTTAAGKGTLAIKLSKELKIPYLAVGQIFRTFGLLSNQRNYTVEKISELWSNKTIKYKSYIGGYFIVFDGEVINSKLDSEETSKETSILSKNSENLILIEKIVKNVGNELKSFVGDGRNLGEYLFPESEIKIYLYAPIEIRAERRLYDLIRQGEKSSLEEQLKNLEERDKKDIERAYMPLIIPKNSYQIDSSMYKLNQIVQIIKEVVLDKSNEKELKTK